MSGLKYSSANPLQSKKVVTHASSLIMMTYICMQNLIEIYHVVHELYAFLLTDHGCTNSHSNYSADSRVLQEYSADKGSCKTHILIIMQTQ